MGLTFMRFLKWWHGRFGHPHHFPVTTRGPVRVTIGLLCTCGQVFNVEGVRYTVVQTALVEIRVDVPKPPENGEAPPPPSPPPAPAAKSSRRKAHAH